jgi:hypothetical protein
LGYELRCVDVLLVIRDVDALTCYCLMMVPGKTGGCWLGDAMTDNSRLNGPVNGSGCASPIHANQSISLPPLVEGKARLKFDSFNYIYSFKWLC